MHRTTLWLAVYLAFVVYGSLVPLDYRPLPFDVAWQRFSEAPFLVLGVESRADWVANGVLYVPLGVIATLVLRQTLAAPWPVAAVLAWLACVLVAGMVELAQVYFPPRTVSRNDLLAEAIGGGLGALAAPWIGGWLDAARRALLARSGDLSILGLRAYFVLYVAFCFFPFDFLVSGAELRNKIASDMWGWIAVPSDRGALIALVKLAVETLLSVPIGILLARIRPRTSPALALTLGVAFGIAIELGQLLIASGVSQGISALARAGGVLLGASLPQRFPDDALTHMRRLGRRFTWPLLLLYVPLLAAVNGFFASAWHGFAGAATTWSSLRLLPFYYHYFTTEAQALFSLASVALMYLPISLLGWAHRLPRAACVALVMLATAAVELAKLFFAGLRPDPTNILVAAAAAWAVLYTIDRVQSPAAPPSPSPRPSTGSPAAAKRSVSWWGPGTLVAGAAIAFALTFPEYRFLLVALLSLAALVVWRFPVLALAIVPAALPALDLAPWTGRFYFDELDLLQAVCFAVALQRVSASARGLRPLDLVLFGLVGASLLLSVLTALLPFQGIDANSFYSYYSQYNALRIAKGALWLVPFMLLWQRVSPREDAERSFTAGMCIGLAWTVAWVLWERMTFSGLTDFTSEFRVSGPFSAMHKGGAYLECYLAVASAFTLSALMRAQRTLPRLAGLLLLGGAAYATLVTFSRGGYAAFLAVLVLTAASALLPALRARKLRDARLLLALSAVVVATTVAVPVLGGSFARERLARTSEDFSARQSHWQDALDMREEDGWTRLFGEGIGRFPDTHFWRSQEATRAASYRLMREGDETFLRLAPGAPLYVDQLLPDLPAKVLFVELRYRTASPEGSLGFSVCRKWLLTSQHCVGGTTPPKGGEGEWRQTRLTLSADALARQGLLPPAPLVFSLFTPEGTKVIDVARVRLLDPQGRDLLENGDFAAGLDRWFFTTNVSQPWYIDSVPVTLLFESGWFGLFAWGVLLATALLQGVTLSWRGRAEVGAAWPALVAFLICGFLNTLVDNPRFVWLLLVVAWMSTLDKSSVRAPSRRSRSTARETKRPRTVQA